MGRWRGLGKLLGANSTEAGAMVSWDLLTHLPTVGLLICTAEVTWTCLGSLSFATFHSVCHTPRNGESGDQLSGSHWKGALFVRGRGLPGSENYCNVQSCRLQDYLLPGLKGMRSWHWVTLPLIGLSLFPWLLTPWSLNSIWKHLP